MKQRWDLIPWSALSEVVDVITHGAQKHGDRWLELDDEVFFNEYAAKVGRHYCKYMKDEPLDESGFHHLAHMIADALFLLAREREE